MSIADELKQLHDLHARGALTDDEYARAKEAVLDATLLPAFDDDDMPPLTGRPGDQAPRYVSLRAVTTAVTVVVFAVVFFVVFLPRLEKGWDNLNRFREGAAQRRQLQESRPKAPLTP